MCFAKCTAKLQTAPLLHRASSLLQKLTFKFYNYVGLLYSINSSIDSILLVNFENYVVLLF